MQIILGKDRGKSGSIERVLAGGGKAVILGLNIVKRHVKKQGDLTGGVLDLSKPIDMSNLAIVCPNCQKPTRVGFKIEGQEKLRICKKCGKAVSLKEGRKAK